MIRVVVVDDEPMVRAHLRTILGASGTIEVVDEAGDGAAGVQAVVRSRPGVVLMDLRMPGTDGITATEQISKLLDPPAVVVLTTFDADQYVLRALRAGASGFLVKDTPRATLVDAVRVVAAGDALLTPRATRRLLAEFVRTAPRTERPASAVLTPREVDVLVALARGGATRRSRRTSWSASTP